MIKSFLQYILMLLTKISPKINSKILYWGIIGKKLNLKNPQNFNEKLMWLKLNKYGNNELVSKCADKYSVREYVKECGCGEILNDLIDVYSNVNDIDFNKLPNKFVLKCNHASGYNIICKDKDKLDERKTKKQLKKWLKNDYWAMYSEIQYKNIERKIVCEKFLESKGENSIVDYKVYCFNGKADFIMICIGRNTGHIKYYYMDKNWKVMKVNDLGMETPDDFQIEKPKCVDKMFEYAEKLAKPFEFVRVDFYDYKDKPVFGELTFTPSACVDTDYTEQGCLQLGKKLRL